MVYALKQSNKSWIELVPKYIKSHGFQCNKYDENFYMKTVRGRRMFCPVCVDGILIATNKKTDTD